MTGQNPDRAQDRGQSSDDALEELEDEAILAQQTAAHSPKPRQQVRMEAQSVVISELAPAAAPAPAPPRPQRPRRPAEPTLIIRDRKRLDELRKAVTASNASRGGRGLWLWLVAGLFAFALGGSLALIASRPERVAPGPAARSDRPPPKSEQEPAEPEARAASPSERIDMREFEKGPKTKITREDPDHVKPVSLDDLPVEK
ncbi:MAG TPA: hypothetical protein VF989_17695 [Polyangiaceae bacterium]